MRGSRKVVPGTRNTDGTHGTGGDKTVDAIVERGDQCQGARNIRRDPAAGSVYRGQKGGSNGVVDDGGVAQHDGVGGQPATNRVP